MWGIESRQLSPEWTILSHVNCFIQGEVIGFQVLLDSLHPHTTRSSCWSPPVLPGEAVNIFLALVSFGMRTMWPNRKRSCAWTIPKRWDCLIVRFTSPFCTWGTIWFLTAFADTTDQGHQSIFHTSLLVTAYTQSHTRRRVECKYYTASAWWRCEILDFQIWLSRFCIAARLIALQCEISEDLWIVEWIREPRQGFDVQT